MLSHHQISTLLLIQRSPYHLESIGHEIAALEHEKLVEIDLPASGVPLARLTSRGKLRLVALSAFNLLPFTEHVETVARFERA